MQALLILGPTALTLAAAAVAQPPRAVLDAAAAQAIVAGCASHAAAHRQSHAIVVVDPGGGEVAALRMDGNGRGIMDFALAKARAVAAWGFSTSAMATAAVQTPGFAAAPQVVTVAGGVPIFSADGRTFLGAAGASGEAPADDEACVTSGVEAAGFKVKRA
jgi:glc operon protein GlcG